MRLLQLSPFLFALACGLGGCHQPAPVPDPFVHDPRAMQWDDLPVPAAYTLDQKESYAYRGAVRTADLVYYGGADVVETERFFAESLPANGWTAVRATGTRRREMLFRKDAQEALVTVVPEGGRTTVRIRLRPRGATETKS